MKKLISVLFALIVSISASSQEKKESKFKKLFKYSTFYAAFSETNSIQGDQTFAVTQWNELLETTVKNPADFKWSVGWRKLANFQYEDRNKFYDGNENNVGTRSNIGNTTGLEYLVEFSKGRQQGNEFENKEAFVRYLGKWWLVKGEYQLNELIDLDYTSAEARLRLPIGKKLSISAGAIYRKAQKAYGHNPIQLYLEDNPWWVLAYDFANHTDQVYEMINPVTGESMGYDYLWYNQAGNLIAASDADYRNGVFQNVVNRYNETKLAEIDPHEYGSLIAGVDFYHYRRNFWLHAYGNVLPKHKLISGDQRYWYGNKNGDDWIDYSVGAIVGLKLGKFGIFTEFAQQRYWDRNLREIKVGLNYKL